MNDQRKDTRLLRDGIFNVPDELQRGRLAKRIAHEASMSSDESRIVGVFGGWGTGKTHVLRLVGQELATNVEKYGAIVALFPAWRYELEWDLGASLFSALSYKRSYPQIATLNDREEVDLPRDVKGTARRLVSLVGSLATPIASLGVPEAAVIKKSAETAEKVLAGQDSKQLPIVEEIAQLFEELVKGICRDKYRRLVVLVDDLDRCSPEHMVQMFEWMKVHLDVPRCSFVVALDHRAAAHAIAGKYRSFLDEEGDVAFGYRYLDKLFHTEFELATSPMVEQMAIRRAFSELDPVPTTFSEAALRVVGTDFPLRPWLTELVGLPALRAARTMLRVAYSYNVVLRSYCDELGPAGFPPDQMLPRNAPFWLLFLVCMQCTLSPDDLDSFVNGQGFLFESATSAEDLPDGLKGLPPESAEKQLGQFLHQKRSESSQSFVPRSQALQKMLVLVRQKVSS